MTLYEGSGFIVGRDNMSIFIDPDGNPTRKHPVKWSDIPIEVGKLCLCIGGYCPFTHGR